MEEWMCDVGKHQSSIHHSQTQEAVVGTTDDAICNRFLDQRREAREPASATATATATVTAIGCSDFAVNKAREAAVEGKIGNWSARWCRYDCPTALLQR